MKFTEFLTKMLGSNTGISSKRVFGGLGFAASIGINIYCALTDKQAPGFSNDVLFTSTGLLGLGSVTKAISSRNSKKMDNEEDLQG